MRPRPRKLNELLAAGAIDQPTYARAVEDANDRALRSSQAWTDGATRFLQDYVGREQRCGHRHQGPYVRSIAFGSAQQPIAVDPPHGAAGRATV